MSACVSYYKPCSPAVHINEKFMYAKYHYIITMSLYKPHNYILVPIKATNVTHPSVFSYQMHFSVFIARVLVGSILYKNIKTLKM